MERKQFWKEWIKRIGAANNTIINDTLLSLGIVSITTLVSLMFEQFDFHESNIIIVFILGVLLVSKQTSGYFYGIFASVVSVLCFNFFFTEPRYTFRVYGSEYLITFPVMLIVSIITSALTTKVKRESELSLLREKRNEILYDISRNLLTTNSIDQIITTTAVNVSNISSCNVIIYMSDKNDELAEPYIYSVSDSPDIKALISVEERDAARSALKSGAVVDSKTYYIPIIGRTKPIGVIGINCGEKPFTGEQKLLFNAIAAQAALSVERELSNMKQHETHLDVESERIRSNLLRAVSHDLKTPLAGIVGSSSTLLENWDQIEDRAKTTLVSDIYDDAQWLTNSVDNILNITKIEDGRIEVRKNLEAAEEVVAEAIGRVKKYAGSRTIKTEVPDELLLIKMDAGLMKQMLVNLLDNAVKFTDENAEIKISVYKEDTYAVFEVSDNGPGIPAKDLPYIFDRFYTIDKGTSKRKGMGLGLAICKSIALAHGGGISVWNKEGGGAVFKATIPIGE
jgi:two-component system sensor histidine kinase KdpD